MLSYKQRRLSRTRTINLLDDLLGVEGDGTSIYFLPGTSRSGVEKVLLTEFGEMNLQVDPAEIISRSFTGAVIFWGELYKYLILPPFPISSEGKMNGYNVVPLRTLLNQKFTVALILIRLGAYAIGIFEGDKLLSSKVGTGLVHSRHKKGGSSARRFERHREKQMETFFTRICERAREQLEPYVNILNYLVYGGERNTVNSFRQQCRFLRLTDDRTVEQLLNVREPRQASLEAAISDVWSSMVIQFSED